MATNDEPSLKERLEKIKSPKLQNQKETAVVLNAIEDTLRDQNQEFTPTAYFAALLSLLTQAISQSTGIVNHELATSVVYLLDTVTPFVPTPLLRSKFSQILTSLAPALTHQDVEAPLLRHSMGCLETLLLSQDSAAWSLPQTQISPRGAIAGILSLAIDHRPKVRKRAQDAVIKILRNPPPSPSLDHPAADMCAETALHSLRDLSQDISKKNRGRSSVQDEQYPDLIHALQLVKALAAASAGWPSKRIDSLCEILLNISKSNSEYLAISSFEVFETIIVGMARSASSSKLARLLEAISELQPSRNDTQLLPPWIAVVARGYDVCAQTEPNETFAKLPELFQMISGFLTSPSHNIRISASECLTSFAATCIPQNVIVEPSAYDEKILEKIGKIVTDLLTVKYQSAWLEVFGILSSLFKALRWRSAPYLNQTIKLVGDLRGNDAFNGKKEADEILSHAINAAGPEVVLSIIPLNLDGSRPSEPGRAWLLPLLRDNVHNATIKHFKTELVPLSDHMSQRVSDHGKAQKTMEVKLFETVVSQIWSVLPGYFTLPLDLLESFDQQLAEMLANLLYQQTNLRNDLCKALEALVESNRQIALVEDGQDDLVQQHRISKEMAKTNLEHLSSFAGNLLAVLFNVYSGTLPHHRAFVLQCINVYLKITPEKDLMQTFEKVLAVLERSLNDLEPASQLNKQKQKPPTDQMPPVSHTLMDLLLTLSTHLPRSAYQRLFSVAALLLPQSSDPQLQKKAYKLLPRLAISETGHQALLERNAELQQLLLSTASSASAPARKDRLQAISVVTEHLPASDLYFIPCVLSEVVMSAKEVNKKARMAAFDLLIQMGQRMAEGGTIDRSKIPHMQHQVTSNAQGSLEEYFTMLSAGLAGNTPHMISATLVALTRVLHEFHTKLPENVLHELVLTVDFFLTSKNREIIRSVIGFCKVSIISLPDAIIRPRLPELIPKIVQWGHEHANQLHLKVKGIIERAVRRFGYEKIAKNCAEEDRKLVHNIQKSKERQKRKKASNATRDVEHKDETAGVNGSRAKQRAKFDSGYDAAVYSSATSDDGSDSESSFNSSLDERARTRNGNGGGKSRKKQGQSKSYITEPGTDEPLDLLDRRQALANISSTKPVRFKDGSKGKSMKKAKVNEDGKLVFGENDDQAMLDAVDAAVEGGDGSLEGGINAYVAAIRGRDAVKRGRGGRLKFSNRKKDDTGVDDEMEIDEEESRSKGRNINGKGKDKERSKSQPRQKDRNGKGSMPVRRGLDGSKRGNPDGNSGGGGGGMKGGRFRVAKQRARGVRGGGFGTGRVKK